MRQAGRYLPEYRAARARAGSFVNLCKTPELACEVTLQPLARFPLDAAILFSDILTIPDAMGLGLSVHEGEGPKLAHPVRTRADIDKLGVPDPETALRYVMDAVRLIRRELNERVPLIGFAGSPWTLACYMIEGEGSSSFARAKALAWNDAATMHRLLDVVARSVSAYLIAQAKAGAQTLMVFDTWGGLLAPDMFRDFSLRYLAQIVQSIQSDIASRDVPVILFSKGANSHLEVLADTGCTGLGLDWTISLDEARRRVGSRVALQGNVDPAVLHADPETIRGEVKKTLDSFGEYDGHVFNLGHGITPDVEPERLGVLIEAVHSLSARG
jgi:uroporphyrinogen decarboxylase